MEGPKKIRTFIALKAPTDWIEALDEIAHTLKKELRSKEIKWVQPEQIHITLRFLGYILPDQVSTVIKSMNEAARTCDAFVLRGSVLGVFPSVRRARVLWLGVEDPEQRTVELQKVITQATNGIGEPAEDREFTPHLTLARIRHLEPSEAGLLDRALKRPVTFSTDWRVSEVLLMQSHLSSSGPLYEVLHSAPLGKRHDFVAN